MITSKPGLDLIREFESCHLRAYPDPNSGLARECRRVGVSIHQYRQVRDWRTFTGSPWTCGWGSTGPDVKPDTEWSQFMADRRFIEDVAIREEIIKRHVTVPMTQGQFDAMVSIVYNVGMGSSVRDGIIRLKNGQPSTLLRKLNAGDVKGAADEFDKWISKGTPVENGLRRRRAAEKLMFLNWTK